MRNRLIHAVFWGASILLIYGAMFAYNRRRETDSTRGP